MGILDDLTDVVNHGSNMAGRAGKLFSINTKIADLENKRKGLMAELGQSVWEDIKDNEDLKLNREELFQRIADLDEDLNSHRQQVADIVAEGTKEKEEYEVKKAIEADARARRDEEARARAAATVAAQMGGQNNVSLPVPGQDPAARCPSCGGQISPADKFCTTCGSKLEEPHVSGDAIAIDNIPSNVCPGCGSTVNSGDAFCMTCGTRLQHVVVASSHSQEAETANSPEDAADQSADAMSDDDLPDVTDVG